MQNMLLVSAIRSGNIHSIIAVLDAGAEITPECLLIAIQKNDSNIVHQLLKRSAKINPECLPAAIHTNNTNTVNQLLQLGAQVTPESLPAAIQKKNANMVFGLLQHGAEVTPEHLLTAIQKKNGNIVCGLLMHGDYKILTKNINPVELANLINICGHSVKNALGQDNINHTINSARSYVEIRKNSRMLWLASGDATTFFSKLPKVLNLKIIEGTRDDEVHDEKQANDIADAHFCKP